MAARNYGWRTGYLLSGNTWDGDGTARYLNCGSYKTTHVIRLRIELYTLKYTHMRPCRSGEIRRSSKDCSDVIFLVLISYCRNKIKSGEVG